MNKYELPELFRTKQKLNRSDSNVELNRSDTQSDHDQSFQPSEISTPISSKAKSINSNLTTTIDDTMANQSITQIDLCNQTSTLVAVNVINPFQGATLTNGVVQLPQYQQVLLQIPTIDVLKFQSQQHEEEKKQELTQQLDERQQQRSPDPTDDTDSVTDRLISRTAVYQLKLFRHLRTDLPVTVVRFSSEHFSILHFSTE